MANRMPLPKASPRKRFVFEANRLVGKTKQDFVCSDDSTGADGLDVLFLHVKFPGDDPGGAGHFWLGFEMFFKNLDVGIRRDVFQYF